MLPLGSSIAVIGLFYLAYQDIRLKKIDVRICNLMIILGFFWNLATYGPIEAILTSLFAVLTYILFNFIVLKTNEQLLGAGDPYLFTAMAMLLPIPQWFATIVLAIVLSLVVARITKVKEVPLAPFLLISIIAVLL